MKIKFIQEYTLGDLFFLQKAVDIVIELGHQVYFPTQYVWISDYIKKTNLFFKDEVVDCEINFHNIVEPNHPCDIMTYKYEIIRNTFNLEENEKTSWNNWQDHLKFERNIEKENNLYYNILGIKECENYVLKNCNFSKNETFNFDVDTNLKIVEMSNIEGYTLIDWCKVIENAKEIWTIDTSTNYLIEVLPTKAERLIVFPRHKEHTKKALSHIWNKNWEWK